MSDAISMSLFVYGLAIVVAMGAALLIKLIVSVLAFGESKATAAATAPPPPPPAMAGLIPEHHLAVIAAAAHAMVGAHRIVHIGHVSNGPVWSTEGRLAHHGSHRPSHH